MADHRLRMRRRHTAPVRHSAVPWALAGLPSQSWSRPGTLSALPWRCCSRASFQQQALLRRTCRPAARSACCSASPACCLRSPRSVSHVHARQQRASRTRPAAADIATGAPPSPNALLPAWPCAAAANCGGYWRADGSSPPPLLFNIEAAAWRALAPHCAECSTPVTAWSRNLKTLVTVKEQASGNYSSQMPCASYFCATPAAGERHWQASCDTR